MYCSCIACRNCSCIVTIGLIHTKCELIFAVPWTNTTKIFASMQERILCRICFEREICIVLLPCRHHVLCELVWMFISIYPHILIIYITINLWEFWSSPLVSLAGLALTSASHVQFADWPLRAGYLFMMQCCQPIHYVMQFSISHVGSSSRVPTSGVGKDGPQDS